MYVHVCVWGEEWRGLKKEVSQATLPQMPSQDIFTAWWIDRLMSICHVMWNCPVYLNITDSSPFII